MIKLFNLDVLEALKRIPDESVDCVVTSPPYWSKRDYETIGQIGMEKTFEEFIQILCDVFEQVKRVLKKDGTCWVVIGDSFVGNGVSRHKGYSDPKRQKIGEINYDEPSGMKQSLPPKCLAQIPSRFAIEMCNRGWILRSEIIWRKPNAMPESCKDRMTIDYEKIFLFVKNKKYFFNQQFEPIKTATIQRNKYGWDGKKVGSHSTKRNPGSFVSKVPKQDLTGNPTYTGFNQRWKEKQNPNGFARNLRTVWNINTKPFKEAHFAVFPPELPERCIKAGCPEKGIVLDPFVGSGTSLLVARELGRDSIGIEINPKYVELCKKRLFKGNQPLNKEEFEIIK